MRSTSVVRSASLVVSGLILVAALAACRGPDGSSADNAPAPDDSLPNNDSGGGVGTGSGPYLGAIALKLSANPSVKYDSANGKTTIVVQYSARGENNVALAKGQYASELRIDDNPLDNESLLDSSSQELAVNLNFAEVLDASYSMVLHSPPAFEPMKKAAADTLQGVLDTWAKRTGNVSFQTIWFAEKLNQTVNDPASARTWQPADLLTLPTPSSGSATKLYAAVQKMAQLMKADRDKGIAASARDHHVMLVFSDGKDNYSWFGNNSTPQLMATSNGASYLQYGAPATKLADVKAAIAAHPSLTVHVIGVGSDIDAVELQEIADAGHGVFLQNPGTEKLADLFNQVLLEFTTIQTEGALVPLPPGDYNVTLVVRNSDGSAADQKSFRIHAGDATAKVLP